MNDKKFYNEYVKTYNISVKHDNEIGRCDSEYAHNLAKGFAEYFYEGKEKEEWLKGWYEFYYHMFD